MKVCDADDSKLHNYKNTNGLGHKWAIVIAGISDLARPAEKLSLTQNGALMATGAIWTRWCLIIKPRNVL